ncbi:MAG: S16 family serine protease [Candidatus Woesearchaeota archaeon]
MKLLVWVAVIAVIIPSVLAQSGTIKLLALAEDSSGISFGAVADLDLRIEPGKNRVYLETVPLTKITTQISMRFAQQIACKELDIDCSDKDFYFTIRALPGIVGGPSAGSTASVLSASLIAGLELRNDTAITGTINSGGIIGPVGGLKEKITAAAKAGITRVLIPMGTANSTDSETNKTTDLVEYGNLLGIEVIEVSTILEALEEYTGRNFTRVPANLTIEPDYQETMKSVAGVLCNRTGQIRESLERHRGDANTTMLEEEALNMSARAKAAFGNSQYYASASFCFRSNVGYKQAWALQRRWAKNDIERALAELNKRIADYSAAIDSRNISSITDLQTYMVVKERLLEAKNLLADTGGNGTAENIAYAEERLYSAKIWARFFDSNDAKYSVSIPSLRDSCAAKISEAEERINYVRSFLPDALDDARAELDRAYKDLASGNYTLCLYKASKSKAQSDVILSVIGVEAARVDDLIDLKREIAKEAIARSQQKGIFPIIGYSYYEYSGSLKEMDKYSALLFAEYALEFSNLDIYFPKTNSKTTTLWQRIEPHFLWIIAGAILGIIISMFAEALQDAIGQMGRKKR